MHNFLFCFWTGNNPMSKNRLLAYNSLVNSGLKVILITNNNLSQWILKEHPLHEAYQYLSFIHRADYLRVYFMHHYGGGYSDIKYINHSWINSWNLLMNSNNFGIGYKEIGYKGVAFIPSLYYFNMLFNCNKLLGNGAYIFKPNTEFTYNWYQLTVRTLDRKLEKLKHNPALHPEDFKGKNLNGKKSKYPLKWSELLGNIFHPLCIKYSDMLLNNLPEPDFHTNYDI